MRWAKIALYLYVAQAAVGVTIGFAIPFLRPAGEQCEAGAPVAPPPQLP
jgi:hypothetical protein